MGVRYKLQIASSLRLHSQIQNSCTNVAKETKGSVQCPTLQILSKGRTDFAAHIPPQRCCSEAPQLPTGALPRCIAPKTWRANQAVPSLGARCSRRLRLLSRDRVRPWAADLDWRPRRWACGRRPNPRLRFVGGQLRKRFARSQKEVVIGWETSGGLRLSEEGGRK